MKSIFLLVVIFVRYARSIDCSFETGRWKGNGNSNSQAASGIECCVLCSQDTQCIHWGFNTVNTICRLYYTNDVLSDLRGQWIRDIPDDCSDEEGRWSGPGDKTERFDTAIECCEACAEDSDCLNWGHNEDTRACKFYNMDSVMPANNADWRRNIAPTSMPTSLPTSVTTTAPPTSLPTSLPTSVPTTSIPTSTPTSEPTPPPTFIACCIIKTVDSNILRDICNQVTRQRACTDFSLGMCEWVCPDTLNDETPPGFTSIDDCPTTCSGYITQMRFIFWGFEDETITITTGTGFTFYNEMLTFGNEINLSGNDGSIFAMTVTYGDTSKEFRLDCMTISLSEQQLQEYFFLPYIELVSISSSGTGLICGYEESPITIQGTECGCGGAFISIKLNYNSEETREAIFKNTDDDVLFSGEVQQRSTVQISNSIYPITEQISLYLGGSSTKVGDISLMCDDIEIGTTFSFFTILEGETELGRLCE